MNRKRLLLLILLGGLGLSLGYAWWATPRQEHAVGKPLAADRPRMASGTGQATVEEGRVRLDLLKPEEEGYPGSIRNIFGSIQPPPPPAPPRSVPTVPPVAVAPPPAPAVVIAPPPSAADLAQRELARFTFLGYLEKGGEQTVFLSGNNELFLAKKGSRFGRNQEFIVAGLTPEKLIVRQADDPREIVINLVEKAPLVPQKPAIGNRSPVRNMPVRALPPPRVQPRRPAVPEPPAEVEPPQQIPGDEAAPPPEAESKPESAPSESPSSATPSEVNQ